MANSEKALSHHYGRLDMHDNRIMNVATPVYPEDVEVHGHGHTALDVGAVAIAEKDQPNGVPGLDIDSHINNECIAMFMENITATEAMITNEAIETEHNIDVTKPITMFIYTADGYRTPTLMYNVDYEIVDNIVSWQTSDLDTIISMNDVFCISYFKASS